MMMKSGSPLPVGSVGEVVGERGGRSGARCVAVALTVLQVGIVRQARRALRLEVVDRRREPLAGGDLLERLDQRWPVAGVDEPGVVGRVEDVEGADRWSLVPGGR